MPRKKGSPKKTTQPSLLMRHHINKSAENKKLELIKRIENLEKRVDSIETLRHTEWHKSVRPLIEEVDLMGEKLDLLMAARER